MKLIAGSGPWYNSDVEWFDQMKASLQEAQISLQMLHSLEGGGEGERSQGILAPGDVGGARGKLAGLWGPGGGH